MWQVAVPHALMENQQNHRSIISKYPSQLGS